jgi:amino acid transporter
MQVMSGAVLEQDGVVVPKGLRSSAIGLTTSIGIGVASTAPAYSMAVTLGFVVALVGLQTPLYVLLAFVPMFMAAWATKLMNHVDPDCGTSFTWAARALGPRTGWFAGGWGTIAADLLAMASYAQIAGQYVFLMLGAHLIGNNPTSVWVLLVGLGWIVGLTYLCYRGIEVSARLQLWLVSIEVAILLLLSVVALIKVANGSAPPGHLTPSWSWFNPADIPSLSTFMQAMLLMVFVYWGWDTTTSVNEETEDPSRIPGNAGVISTLLLLVTYLLVVVSVQSFAGVSTSGIGLGNPNHQGDVLSVMGSAIFGTSTVGTILSRLLLLMVLTSAAATTQTTILPNARTMLSMAFHRAIPERFGHTHPVYLTPTFSTVLFGVISVVYYAILNFVAGGNVIADAVTATTFFAALYLGITGVAAAWHYRTSITAGVRAGFSRFVIPALAAISLFTVLGWSIKIYADPSQSYVDINLPIFGEVGSVLLIVVGAALAGLLWMLWCEWKLPAYFRGDTMASGVSLTDEDDVVGVSWD